MLSKFLYLYTVFPCIKALAFISFPELLIQPEIYRALVKTHLGLSDTHCLIEFESCSSYLIKNSQAVKKGAASKKPG